MAGTCALMLLVIIATRALGSEQQPPTDAELIAALTSDRATRLRLRARRLWSRHEGHSPGSLRALEAFDRHEYRTW